MDPTENEMIFIPLDIQAGLGALTGKQAGVIERLLATGGEDHIQALVRDIQAKL